MESFISLFGIFVFIGIGYAISANRKAIIWRPVIWGIALQFIVAVVILKIPGTYLVFDAIGAVVTQFLDFTVEGAKFVFGENYEEHFFAFKVLPTIIFFSSFVSVLYYLGILQQIVKGVAWVMLKTTKTSGAESLSNAANVFVGMTEAPLLVKPFINTMTKSELNTIMTGGFATVAGGVLAAYVSFGISARDLISASVMAAPCALGISKLLYPETEKPETAGTLELKVEKTATNVVDAAAAGAIEGAKLAVNIAAVIIAFLALIAFLNAILSWFGGLFDYPQLSFDLILGWVLYPIALLTGVSWSDASQVAALIGKKIILNEFIAYVDLAALVKNNLLSERSIRIATFALCSFANIGSIGIQIGALSGIAPQRRSELAELGIRAMIGGVLTNLIVAATAGFLL
ncbi:NupC/NupG family nucleoside CNT transporter [Limnoraphis robusta]|uniref:Nucleoside permease n=1 Tax=Limnoraphis robusta CCNP1315 TaxID=3110306 RepID=A0ABU5TY73_9CYAN|nr:NupC/NupG family nucleoside CNT transporter [Limnoraphis robusta]MEA5518878.1 NupC/NupG family nucleoside CNT transporter [Limnoraphis robusta CCNP1315]MEA5548363.1 NupC/NupG family nucleoside CNT transporter [Limnoraphis robusta CCNP1324]